MSRCHGVTTPSGAIVPPGYNRRQLFRANGRSKLSNRSHPAAPTERRNVVEFCPPGQRSKRSQPWACPLPPAVGRMNELTRERPSLATETRNFTTMNQTAQLQERELVTLQLPSSDWCHRRQPAFSLTKLSRLHGWGFVRSGCLGKAA